MIYKRDADINSVTAQAIMDCKVKGGPNPEIVWSQRSNLRSTKPSANHGMPVISITHGAIAISDDGAGTIVGWSFNHPYHDKQRAVKDCQKRGGQNPKIVKAF